MVWDGEERRRTGANLVEKVHDMDITLNSLKTEIVAKREADEEIIRRLTELTEDHHGMIYGSKENTGMREEVNTLKAAEQKRDRHLMALTLAVIGTIVSAIGNYLWKKLTGGNP